MRYATPLQPLCAARKRERTWPATLDPWDFAPFLLEKRRDFSGREWLFEEIELWRRSPKSGALLLMGEPGIGKSAIVAELVTTNPHGQVLAYHCCQADTPATLEPGRFVRSIAAMIATRLDGYAALLDGPDVQQALAEANAVADPASALEAGVLAPLHRLSESAVREAAADGPRLLVVDALDEALTLRAGVTIVDVLASRAQRMPPWLRLVATTRDDRGVRKRLAGLNVRAMLADDARNLEDVRRHVERRLATPALQRSAVNQTRANLVDTLLAASQGNFLFVTRALDAVQAGQVSFAQLQALPPGLGSLYQLFFSRLFPGGAEEYAQAQVVLQVLVAAREPLSRDQLAQATGFDAEDELPIVLSRISAFVPQRDGRYSLFHRSLFEWLTGWDRALDEPHAASFFANPKKGHARLADWGWLEYAKGAGALSAYALHHLRRHLAGAGRANDLAALLTDWRYLERKVEGTDAAGTTVFDLISDLALARETLPAAHPRRHLLSLLEEAIRLDTELIARHPTALFQCSWNHCWWYDAPAAANYHEAFSDDPPAPDAPWRRPGDKAYAFVDAWRAQKEREKPGFVWLRALRPIPSSIGGAQRAVLQAHLKGKINIHLSEDETRLVSGTEWGSIRLWDLGSGATLAVIDIDESVQGLRFQPSSEHVIVASSHHVLVISAETLAIEERWPITGDFVTVMDLSPDGSCVALGHMDGRLHLLDLRRTIIYEYKAHNDSVSAVSFSPDGRRLVSSAETQLCEMEFANDQLIELDRITAEANVEAIAFAPDARCLAWADTAGRITCRDQRSGEQWNIQALPGNVSSLAFHPEGGRLFYGGGDVGSDVEAEIGVLDLTTRKIERRLYGHSSAVLDLLVWSGGRALVSSGHDSTIRLWSLDVMDGTFDLPFWERLIEHVAFSPDGGRIYTASRDADSVAIRQLALGEPVTYYQHERGIVGIALSPDGRLLVACDRAGICHLWDTERHQAVGSIATSETLPRSMRVSAGGRLLAILAYNGVRFFDLCERVQMLALPNGKNPHFDDIIFSEDGSLLAAIGDKSITIVDTAAATVTAELESPGFSHQWTSVFSPDGKALVLEGREGTLRVLDVTTGQKSEPTRQIQLAFQRAVDFDSAFGWGVGAPPYETEKSESQATLELTLGIKKTGEPLGWIRLPWASHVWPHPSGRIWALEHYRQLHIYALEGV